MRLPAEPCEEAIWLCDKRVDVKACALVLADSRHRAQILATALPFSGVLLKRHFVGAEKTLHWG